MLRFSANLTMLFNEVDFLARFEKAARAGFKGIEYLFPYEWGKDQLIDKLGENSLIQVLYNLPVGDWSAGERGIACIPGRKTEFQEGVGKAIDYAKALGCFQINCLVGLTPQMCPSRRCERHSSTIFDLRQGPSITKAYVCSLSR